ncbi:MAG TPA: helix-turn-helix transcriptional regulator [Mesotoga sp.]|jgi:putative transcriptional regulator|nr:helix-turn-helix transcriptional regulator [Mesotoga sp.]MDI9374899.1 helix-turn-helix transcriptional regulator [Thermotogota bacterium]NLX34725.1 helix-turn-helix transcriptional regulator [Thermotogaceae bacterium]MDD4041034.1 helix-turn-helix transcriptional regulator [Mesotoga sp.]MDD5744443.1 helix-turn-helix transcriptional regulator [Mesotoga sp.]
MKNRLREFRFKNDEITQESLAELVGVSRQTIIAIEKGRFNPSVKLALKIARVLRCRAEDLFIIEEGD